METNYGLEVSKPPGMSVEDLETVVGREEVPRSYAKRLYARAKRIYNETKELFECDEDLKGYNVIAAPIIMVLGAATGAAEAGIIIGAILLGVGAGKISEAGLKGKYDTDKSSRNEGLAVGGLL